MNNNNPYSANTYYGDNPYNIYNNNYIRDNPNPYVKNNNNPYPWEYI